MKGLRRPCPCRRRKHRLPVHRRAEPKLCPQDTEPRTSATRVGSRCARAAETRRTGHMFARHDIMALGQLPAATSAQKCSECGVRGQEPARRGWGGRWPAPSSPPRRQSCTRALCPVLHRQEVAAVHPLLPGHAGVGRGRRRWAGERPGRGSRAGPCRESRVHCVDLESACVQGWRLHGSGGAGERGLLGAPGPGLGNANAPRRLRPPCPRR